MHGLCSRGSTFQPIRWTMIRNVSRFPLARRIQFSCFPLAHRRQLRCCPHSVGDTLAGQALKGWSRPLRQRGRLSARQPGQGPTGGSPVEPQNLTFRLTCAALTADGHRRAAFTKCLCLRPTRSLVSKPDLALSGNVTRYLEYVAGVVADSAFDGHLLEKRMLLEAAAREPTNTAPATARCENIAMN